MIRVIPFVFCLNLFGVGAHAGALPEGIASMTCRVFSERVTAYTAKNTGADAQAEVILQTIRESPMMRAITNTMNDLDTDARHRILPPFMELFAQACPIVRSNVSADDTDTVGEAFEKAAASLELDPTAPRWGLKDAPDDLDYNTMTCMEIVEVSRKISGRPHNPVNDLARAAIPRYLNAYDLSTAENIRKAKAASTMLAVLSASYPNTPCKEVMDRAATKLGLERK